MKLFEFLLTRNTLSAVALAIALAAALTVLPGNANADAYSNIFGERQISVVSTTAEAGTDVTVSIELDSQGNEVAASFTLAYDPLVLTNPVVTIGTGVPAGSSLSVNTDQMASGRLGILVDSVNSFATSPPNRQIVAVRFTVPSGAPVGTTPIIFVTTPTPLSVASAFGALLATTYQVGTVTVTAAPVSFVTIGGRVTTPSGQNLRNAIVSLIDSAGVRRTATTSSFGIYSFTNVSTGQTYTLTVSSKRYRYAPRVETVATAVSNLDFIGLE